MGHVGDALDVGADVVVAQGAEADGHGAARGTLSFVPEAADFIAQRSSSTLLLAAGGIADGRGLAAALMLGADGVLVGTRLWASSEALVAKTHHRAILESDGDGTLRTTVADIARQILWPKGFTGRVRRNAFTDRWHGREDKLEASIAVEGPRYRHAFAEAIRIMPLSGLARRLASSTLLNRLQSLLSECRRRLLSTSRAMDEPRSLSDRAITENDKTVSAIDVGG